MLAKSYNTDYTQDHRQPGFAHFHSFILIIAKHVKGLIYANPSFKLVSSRVQVQVEESVILACLYSEPRVCLYGCSGCAPHKGALSEGSHSHRRHHIQKAQASVEFWASRLVWGLGKGLRGLVCPIPATVRNSFKHEMTWGGTSDVSEASSIPALTWIRSCAQHCAEPCTSITAFAPSSHEVRVSQAAQW